MATKALVSKALAAFKERLQRKHPDFLEVPSAAPWLQAFRRHVAGKSAVFIIWQFHDRDDAFTLEVGWSQKGRCPGGPRQRAFSPAKNPPSVDGGLLFRLGSFLQRQPRDFWWDITTGKEFHLEAEPLPGVEPGIGLENALDSALILLEKGLEYVERRAVEGLTENDGRSIQSSTPQAGAGSESAVEKRGTARNVRAPLEKKRTRVVTKTSRGPRGTAPTAPTRKL